MDKTSAGRVALKTLKTSAGKAKRRRRSLSKTLNRFKSEESQSPAAGQEEYQRLLRDLHDGVGAKLTGLALIAKTLAQKLATGMPTEHLLAIELLDYIRETVVEVRQMTEGRSAIELSQGGLRGALADLARKTEHRFGINCRLESKFGAEDCPQIVAHHLFRISQEAVFNAIRHGRAKNIVIRLQLTERQLKLSVKDDGIGLKNSGCCSLGQGLANMRSRILLLNGKFQIKSATPRGVTVSCIVALPKVKTRERLVALF